MTSIEALHDGGTRFLSEATVHLEANTFVSARSADVRRGREKKRGLAPGFISSQTACGPAKWWKGSRPFGPDISGSQTLVTGILDLSFSAWMSSCAAHLTWRKPQKDRIWNRYCASTKLATLSIPPLRFTRRRPGTRDRRFASVARRPSADTQGGKSQATVVNEEVK